MRLPLGPLAQVQALAAGFVVPSAAFCFQRECDPPTLRCHLGPNTLQHLLLPTRIGETINGMQVSCPLGFASTKGNITPHFMRHLNSQIVYLE